MADNACELVRLVGTCPGCGHRRLRAVFNGDQTDFRCRRCGSCWRWEEGSVERIEPSACGRCRFRALCLAVIQDEPLDAA